MNIHVNDVLCCQYFCLAAISPHDTLEALLRYTMSHVAKHVICNLSINNDDDDDDSDIASKVKINLENTVMITTIVATMLKLWLLR